MMSGAWGGRGFVCRGQPRYIRDDGARCARGGREADGE